MPVDFKSGGLIFLTKNTSIYATKYLQFLTEREGSLVTFLILLGVWDLFFLTGLGS